MYKIKGLKSQHTKKNLKVYHLAVPKAYCTILLKDKALTIQFSLYTWNTLLIVFNSTMSDTEAIDFTSLFISYVGFISRSEASRSRRMSYVDAYDIYFHFGLSAIAERMAAASSSRSWNAGFSLMIQSNETPPAPLLSCTYVECIDIFHHVHLTA